MQEHWQFLDSPYKIGYLFPQQECVILTDKVLKH